MRRYLAKQVLADLERYKNPKEDGSGDRRPLTVEEKINFHSAQCNSLINKLSAAGVIDTAQFIQIICALEIFKGFSHGENKLSPSHLQALNTVIELTTPAPE